MLHPTIELVHNYSDNWENWQYENLPVIHAPLYPHLCNVQYTKSGYGSKIPSEYKVRYNNRLYRVYAICYSNIASYYILVNKQKQRVEIYQKRN